MEEKQFKVIARDEWKQHFQGDAQDIQKGIGKLTSGLGNMASNVGDAVARAGAKAMEYSMAVQNLADGMKEVGETVYQFVEAASPPTRSQQPHFLDYKKGGYVSREKGRTVTHEDWRAKNKRVEKRRARRKANKRRG